MEKKIEDLPKINYSMNKHYVVTVGSKWDYNRLLDHTSHTRNLIVKAIHKGIFSELMIEFEQSMPFKMYGIGYFDGIVFKPCRKIKPLRTL